MIEIDHIKDRITFHEGTQKCGPVPPASAGRSFAEPAVSAAGSDLLASLHQCGHRSTRFKLTVTDGENSPNSGRGADRFLH